MAERRFRISDFGFRIFPGIIRQFHDVEEIAFAAADVIERKLAGMLAGETLEVLDAFKLALEGAVVVECVTPDDLHCAQSASGAAREPDIAIRATTDPAQQFVVRDRRRSSLAGCGNGAFSQGANRQRRL